MEVKFDTDQLLPCMCGFKPDHYSVFYGPTPYEISCPSCKKHLGQAKCKVTGSPDNAIDYWNSHIRHITADQLNAEYWSYRESLRQDHERRYEEVYWYAGRSEVIRRSERR